MRGRVKWFNDRKGFGFIIPDDASRDVFVHKQRLIGEVFATLRKGQMVEFDVEDSGKGPSAINIHAGDCPACNGTGMRRAEEAV